MDISDRTELRRAMERLADRTGVVLPRPVADEYLRGEVKQIDTHDGLRGAVTTLHPLVRYLAVCESYVLQPQLGEEPRLDLFYNIYAAARAVPMVRALDRALGALPVDTVGLGEKLQELRSSTTFSELESTIFEFVTAARYHTTLNAPIEFIHDKSRRSPDFLCRASQVIAVECKKYDKYNEISRELREVVNDLLVPTVMTFAAGGISALVDVRFKGDPRGLSHAAITKLAVQSLTRERAVRDHGVSVRTRPLPPPDLSTLWLFPSPKFHADRYGFYPGCSWNGLVNRMSCTLAGPSIVDDISWEGAARWRLEDEDIVWRKRKLNYATMFSGVDQLRGWGDVRVLHVALDRDPAVGPRPDSLIGFLNKLYGGKDKSVADWIVFNELMTFPTVTGHLDFREHAHQVSNWQMNSKPPVALVFVGPEDAVDGEGSWGVGHDLPPL